MKVIQETRRVH